MKLKSGFVLKEIAGECVAVPTEAALNFDGMIALNQTAKTIWLILAEGAEREDIIRKLTEEYGITEELAAKATDMFVDRLGELGFLQ